MASRKWTRRRLMKNGVIGAAALATGTLPKAARAALGANERIRIAVAGINGRGSAHINGFSGIKDVEVAYLIDPDRRLFEHRSKQVQDKGGKAPQVVEDLRRALEDKNLDVLSVASPNHWHSLMTILACQAGKDVYVEKPLSHDVHEGRIAVDTARKYNRIVQHGTQNRSSRTWANVMAVIKSGQLGKLLIARGLCYKKRDSIGFKSPATPPPELDFDLWLGPAASRPYHENLVHYNWHWFWDFGNGDIGNQGVHEMDIARWGIEGATLPKSVISLGGRFGYSDQGQTANTQITVMDFGQTQLIFEVRGLKTDRHMGVGVGNIFHLEGGTIVDNKFYPAGSKEPAPLPKIDESRGPGSSPFKNFIAAVRSRKVSDLNADILEGHYSSALCHLANISYRLGEEVPFEPRTGAFGDNKDAYETLARMEDHLKSNEIKLEGLNYRLGRRIEVDAKAETITNDDEANRMLIGNYRQPFVVPETV
ncbi:MAG: Gfo/Idh/MocA family oxidoreductase [Phycisphaerae bacterium]|mgnify:CR=1 FL=1|nr:Gfo/Idh/MocA family oxidoreductase [Phycisphaerae bacterium]